ncbi:MAG: hypothetical protein JSW73_00755 [Candidatus Woesearchaeota archaeon]|nr:MAG: hypothetical protein JSW73_00755 [Candidatus Woesearchaeota archaeon]
MLGASETIMWAVVLGLLIGIVWSLKYIVVLDRKIERIEYKIEKAIRKIESLEESILRKSKTAKGKK